MLNNFFSRLTEKYYNFWVQLNIRKKRVHILPVNFYAPWPTIIWAQKKYFLGAFLSETFVQVFYTLVPLLIGWILEHRQFTYFIYLIMVWLFAILGELLSIYCSIILQIQCINSVQYNAYKFFLTVDPIHHTLRSTGKLFAKIERGARSYEDFLDLLMLDLVPTVISVITVISSFFWVDPSLGLLTFVLLVIMSIVNITLTLFTGFAFEKRLIEADDAVKALGTESLNQVQLIRSAFASNEIDEQVFKRNQALMLTESSAWLASTTGTFLTRMLYIITVFILGSALFPALTAGKMSTLIATTILLTYIRGTYEVIKIGRRLRKLLKSITRINDLFVFVQNFGKQTFPVLSVCLSSQEQQALRKQRDQEYITLEVKNLSFDYTPKAKIFENQHLFLKASSAQRPKLYGIIGPSGMGKTTLLSILGGQLNPSTGTVTINTIPIYAVDDTVRRCLVAVQGQVATSLSGTLKSNLLLGLPKDTSIYTDSYLIDTLKEVGIWPLFEEKQGLATIIGEGGMTLSGGQRQRLNFASLYLRAQYYNPLVILIDEPTSSLDEVSEKAITAMISQLANHALTLVIAHRIKTLEDAVAILDFSLLEKEQQMVFYAKQELQEKSSYYRRLLHGDINLEI